MTEIQEPASTDRPLVTLFVIAYRQEAFVREAIEGAFAQTYQPLEILLSDDASPDRTFEIMAEMAAAYDGPHRVRLNRNPRNLGINAHVNRMMELASGELIVNAAGDDVSLPHRVERLASAWMAGNGNVMSVHSPVEKIDALGRLLGRRDERPEIVFWSRADPWIIARHRANCTGATQAWSRKVFDYFGPLPEGPGVEDAMIFFRAALLGEIAYVDEPLVQYRLGGLSTPDKKSPGEEHLYGYPARKNKWWLTNYRGFCADIKKMNDPVLSDLYLFCKSKVKEYDFRSHLPDDSQFELIKKLKTSFIFSIKEKSLVFLVENIKYIFSKMYIRYHNMRYG